MREDLGLVVVGALLEVWVLLVCLGVLDLVVRVDRVQDVGRELAATATEPGDVGARVTCLHLYVQAQLV